VAVDDDRLATAFGSGQRECGRGAAGGYRHGVALHTVQVDEGRPAEVLHGSTRVAGLDAHDEWIARRYPHPGFPSPAAAPGRHDRIMKPRSSKVGAGQRVVRTVSVAVRAIRRLGASGRGHIADSVAAANLFQWCLHRSEGIRRCRQDAVCKTVGSAYVDSNPTLATSCENGLLAGNSRLCGRHRHRRAAGPAHPQRGLRERAGHRDVASPSPSPSPSPSSGEGSLGFRLLG
jgi:hypothetical protein